MRNAGSEHWVHRAADWLLDNWVDVCREIVTLAFIPVTLSTSDEIARKFVSENYVGVFQVIAVIAIFVLIALQIVLVVMACKHKDSASEKDRGIARLTDKAAERELPVRELIYSYLRELAEKDLTFGEKLGQSERLTLYLHDDELRVFVPLARYSNSPEFCQIARRQYPDNQGCLAKVWNNGWHCVHDYPDPATQLENYLERSARDGVPDTVVMHMKMKSRFYCGTAVWNKDRTRQVCVLLLESTYDRYQNSFIQSYMKKHEHGYLGELVAALG